MILSSASRRSQHDSPASLATGRDGACPRLQSQPVHRAQAQPFPAMNRRVGRIPPGIPAGSGAVCMRLGASALLPALPALSCCHTFHLAPC